MHLDPVLHCYLTTRHVKCLSNEDTLRNWLAEKLSQPVSNELQRKEEQLRHVGSGSASGEVLSSCLNPISNTQEQNIGCQNPSLGCHLNLEMPEVYHLIHSSEGGQDT